MQVVVVVVEVAIRRYRRVPITDGPIADDIKSVNLSEMIKDPLKDMFDELRSRFEKRLLKVAGDYVATLEDTEDFQVTIDPITLDSEEDLNVEVSYVSSLSFSILVGIDKEELLMWTQGYATDPYFSNLLFNLRKESKWNNPSFPQYHYGENGLIYFEDWNGNNKLCVPKNLQNKITAEMHDSISEGAHAGYYKTYN